MIQNISHCNGQPLLEIMPKAISESLYFVVGPYSGPIFSPCLPFRDWSLITGRGGGLQNGRGGHVKFYPYEKGGREKFKPR